MFLIKIVQKSRKQTVKQKQKNQGKKKIRQKENKAKKVSKKFVKVTVKRKDIEGILKLKIKIKQYSVSALFSKQNGTSQGLLFLL